MKIFVSSTTVFFKYTPVFFSVYLGSQPFFSYRPLFKAKLPTPPTPFRFKKICFRCYSYSLGPIEKMVNFYYILKIYLQENITILY